MRFASLALTALSTGILLTVAPPASAADGRIPIGTIPFTISTNGSYYLTADLTSSSSTDAITVNAGNVTIDLNGHSLTNLSGFANGITLSSGWTNLRVANGSIVGGSVAIEVVQAVAGTIAVDNCSITGFSAGGISVTGGSNFPTVDLTNNRISLNSFTGPTNWSAIYLTKVWGGRIVSNTIVGNGPTTGWNMLITNGNNLLIANNSSSYAYIGISIDSSTSLKVAGNNCSHNNVGILVQSSTSIDIEENLMTANTTYGLDFSGAVASWVYRNNVATLNSSANYATSGGTNAGGNY